MSMLIMAVGIYSYTFDFDTFKCFIFRFFFRNDFWDHFDTFEENFYFDTFKNDTFESVWVDAHSQSGMVCTPLKKVFPQNLLT